MITVVFYNTVIQLRKIIHSLIPSFEMTDIRVELFIVSGILIKHHFLIVESMLL